MTVCRPRRKWVKRCHGRWGWAKGCQTHMGILLENRLNGQDNTLFQRAQWVRQLYIVRVVLGRGCTSNLLSHHSFWRTIVSFMKETWV